MAESPSVIEEKGTYLNVFIRGKKREEWNTRSSD